MEQIKYECTHCGKKFEAEAKDIVECPSCFWSSSVKPLDQVKEESDAILSAPTKPAQTSFLSRIPWKFALLLMVVGGLIFWIYENRSQVSEWVASDQEAPIEIVETGQGEIDFDESLPEEIQPSPWETLTESEKNILTRGSVFKAEREVSPAERAVLSNRAPYQTGLVEQLPSDTWSLERFKDLIKSQEETYKVRLPRSYKKKVEKHFTETHLPANAAFESGDMLLARNKWVESLAFPLFSNDIQKHRGVALTMFRPLITDTLSKVSATNNILTERQLRETEIQVSEHYEKLLALLTRNAWAEVDAQILTLNRLIDQLMKPETIVSGPPPYPASFAQIDAGIRETLYRLQEIPTPPVSDYEPLRIDLSKKRWIVLSFLPIELEKQMLLYQEGMDKIRLEQTAEAIRAFEKIEFPQALVEDSKEKLKVLNRLLNSES